MVSFKSVKEKVTLKKVLEHYEILDHLSERGKSLRGTCPFCGSEEDNPFSVSLEKNCFNAFCCGKHGNVIDFVAEMDSLSITQAAQKLDQLFTAEVGKRKERKRATQVKTEAKQTLKINKGDEINPPLTFTLKGVDPAHSIIAEFGIQEDTAKAFGAGYYSGRGMFKDHVVIPIHSYEGKIIGYCGIHPGEPSKLIYPEKLHREKELFAHHELLNRIRVNEPLVICRNPLEVLLITQVGYQAVAIMGNQICKEQVKRLLYICKPGTKLIVFMPINDEHTVNILAQLITIFHVRLVRFTPNTETPLGFLPEDIPDLLKW